MTEETTRDVGHGDFSVAFTKISLCLCGQMTKYRWHCCGIITECLCPEDADYGVKVSLENWSLLRSSVWAWACLLQHFYLCSI